MKHYLCTKFYEDRETGEGVILEFHEEDKPSCVKVFNHLFGMPENILINSIPLMVVTPYKPVSGKPSALVVEELRPGHPAYGLPIGYCKTLLA